MMHYYISGKTPNEYENQTEDCCLLATPHQCQLRTMWQSKYPGLNSRSHCPDHPLVSTQHILGVYKLGVKIVDLPMSGKKMVAQA
jgi:hypothetical protein